MQIRTTGYKLDQIANFIIFMQIITSLFNIGFGIWAASSFYLLKYSLYGMLTRAGIQLVIMLWLVNREKDEPKRLTAWGIFICCLASGFTNIFSSPTSFTWGNLELILIVCGIILLFRHAAYAKAVREDIEVNKQKQQLEE